MSYPRPCRGCGTEIILVIKNPTGGLAEPDHVEADCLALRLDTLRRTLHDADMEPSETVAALKALFVETAKCPSCGETVTLPHSCVTLGAPPPSGVLLADSSGDVERGSTIERYGITQCRECGKPM